MKKQKEFQQTIFTEEKGRTVVTQEEFFDILKIIAPGTNLRTALESIVNYGKGGLIVIDNGALTPFLDGGFKINCKFTPQKLMELSKMDGAIILSKDLKNITAANVLLTPSPAIYTSETGTKHKAAERTAKQINGLAIAISEKKKEISVFYKNKKYPLKNTSEIIRKANEYTQILEKQRELFDIYLDTLNRMELKNYINLNHAIKTIQKGKVIQKISNEMNPYIIELGKESSLLKTRLKEIVSDVERETNLVVKDYSKIDDKVTLDILDNLSYDDLLDKDRIFGSLGQEQLRKNTPIVGWRILLLKTLLTESEIALLAREDINLTKIVSSETNVCPQVIDEEKFILLKIDLEKLKIGL